MRRRHIPIRTCVGCLHRRPKYDLVRLVVRGDGLSSCGQGGRGLYLCRDVTCLEKAVKRKAIRRLLGRHATDKDIAQLRRVVLRENDLDVRHGKGVLCCMRSGGGGVA